MTDVYAAVEAVARDTSLALTHVCDVLAVCRSAYYAWRTGMPSPREQDDRQVSERVTAIFWRHKRRYGARRIASELADHGIVCSDRRVAKLLKRQGLC